jgi:hypothetical protein
MPYIKQENRAQLDLSILYIIEQIKGNVTRTENNTYFHANKNNLSNNDLLSICGDINYVFSRIIGGLMGEVSYPKIAIITGVLENIKQEYYRRIAENYEDIKIKHNGDIPEYQRTK